MTKRGMTMPETTTMNKHLDNYLCKKYPKIFAGRDKSPQKTCMCWGFPGDGWFRILDIACGQIQHHINQPRWVEKRGNSLKRWYNLTVWNWIVYPIAKFVAFGELPKKGFTVSTVTHSKRQWAIYYWFYKWFHFDIMYEKPKNPPSQLVADQVKEKFGTLRFYCHGGDEYTRGMVDLTEALSSCICEDCGAMDETVGRNSSGWIRTTCEKCTPKEDLDGHKKNRNKELVKIWKIVRNENKRKTTSNTR